MNKSELIEKVQKIFRDVFNDESIVISESMTADDIDEWDSFNHINLVSAIEQAFGIQFALGELQDLENVGDMISLMLNEKLV